MGIPEVTLLSTEITTILEQQGDAASVESVRAEIIRRVPRIEALAEALGAHNVMQTMRKLDRLIAQRIDQRPRDRLRREMTRRGAEWLP